MSKLVKTVGNPRDDRFICRVVTCEKNWIYFSNRNMQSHWLNHGGQVAKLLALLCVWCNFEGVLHFELFPKGRTIYVELYCPQFV